MRDRVERRLVLVTIAVSLGLTGLTVWAVARQGRALRDRELADLRAAAGTVAAHRRAALTGDLERAFEAAGRAWQAGGADEIDAWFTGLNRWLLCAAVAPDGTVTFFPRTPLETPLPNAQDTQPAASQRDLLSRLHDLQRLATSPDPLTQAGTLLAMAACEQQLGHPLAAARILADAAQLLRSTPRLARLAFRAELARVESLETAGDHPRAREALAGLLTSLLAEHRSRMSLSEVERLAVRAVALVVPPDDALAVALAELRTRAERRARVVGAVTQHLTAGETVATTAAGFPDTAVIRTSSHPSPSPSGSDGQRPSGDRPGEAGELLVMFTQPLTSGPRAVLVSPAADLLGRYWQETGSVWQLQTGNPAAGSPVLAELGPAFGDAVLGPTPATMARLQAVARRQWGLVLATAIGTAGAWGLVLWMMMRAVARQRELARVQGRFVADVSHELKTPLALIRLLSETLTTQRVRDPQRMHAYHQTITREAERLTVLLDNILDLGRIESGRKKYEFGSCDVGGVAREAWALFEPQFADDGFETHLEIEPNLPVIRADGQAVHQVLVNLLQNAYRYSGQGKYVRLAVRREGYVLLITVEDHGIGMGRSQLRRLGESFFRADDTRVRQHRGAGLGLAIVHHIVTAHGGKIDVQSRPGQGSTFTVWIPFQPEDG